MKRISIRFLREQCDDDTLDLIEAEDMDAVIEVLEAAHSWLESGAESIRYPDLGDYEELERLQRAVARFDFDARPRRRNA